MYFRIPFLFPNEFKPSVEVDEGMANVSSGLKHTPNNRTPWSQEPFQQITSDSRVLINRPKPSWRSSSSFNYCYVWLILIL